MVIHGGGAPGEPKNRKKVYPYIEGKPFKLEKALQKACCQYLALHHWEVIRFKEGPFTEKGVADTMIIKNGVHIWVEYKGPRAAWTPEQQGFKMRVERACGTYWLIHDPRELVDHLNELGI